MRTLRQSPWLMVPWLVGLGAILAGTLVGVDELALWFQHPARNPMPETTMQGARLFRLMLFVGGAGVIALTWMIARIGRVEATSSDGPESSDPAHWSDTWIVSAAIGLALLIRIHPFGESLWYDEIAALLQFSVHGVGVSLGNYFDPANHIGHTVMAAISLQWFEPSLGLETALRLPAFVGSLATTPAMYLLGRDAAGRHVGLAAAVLSAVMPVMVLEGAEARGYALMIATSAWSSWLLIRAMRDNDPRFWCGYALLASIGVWVHFLTAMVIFGQIVWCAIVLVGRRIRGGSDAKTLAAMALSVVLAGIIGTALCSAALPDFLDLLRHRTVFSASGDEPMLFGPEGLHLALQLGGSWWTWSALPGFVLLLVGIIGARQLSSARHCFIMTWLGLPVFVAVVLASHSWMYARFGLFIMPGVIFAMSLGVATMAKWNRWVAYCVGIAVAIVWVLQIGLIPPKQPLRESMLRAIERDQDRAGIAVIGLQHDVMAVYAPNDRRVSYLHHDDADLADQWRRITPGAVIVLYPHLLTTAETSLLIERGYRIDRTLPGWADWGRGGVEVWSR